MILQYMNDVDTAETLKIYVQAATHIIKINIQSARIDAFFLVYSVTLNRSLYVVILYLHFEMYKKTRWWRQF